MSDELKEWERLQSLLVNLESQEAFKEWRNQVCLPLLDRIEQAKRNVVALSEADVKAFILNELFIKDTFFNCFTQAKEAKQADKEAEEAVKKHI